MVAEHEWSPWTITKQPTCMEEGERVSTCVLCDETKTEKVAKISHKLDANNKCTMCGSYYVLSSAGNGETLVDKLKNALDGINSSSAESKVLYLESGEYDLSQIDDLVISVSGLTIHGASSTDGAKTTFVVPSTKSLKVTGDSFALDNVAFSLTGDSQSSTEPVLSLTGDKATVKNTSFEMGSYTNPAIGVIEEGQTLTLDSVTISGGGTLKTEGTLVITGSNIKTTVSPAINGDKGDITIKSSTIEGSLTTSENLNSLTIEGSTLTGGKGEIRGADVTIKDSTLNNWNLSVDAKTTTVANSTINSDSIKISGTDGSSAKVENSNLTAADVVISAESNTITGSNINKGQKDNSLTIGGKTAEVASSTLDGKVTVSTSEKTDIKENSSINASDTKSDGTFVVESGEINISDSKLSGDITFKTGTTQATIENSTIDTSTGSNALTTGTNLEIKDSTITEGSGLYVTKDAKNIDIAITNSSVSDGSNVDNITSENVTTEVFSKSVPEDKKSSVIALSDSQSSASLKVGTDYTSVPFTFKDSNENEIRVNIGKKGSTVNLGEFFNKNVKDYVNPTFYTDSSCSNEISDSKITVVDANKYKVGDKEYNSVYVKWEYRVTYTDGEGKEKTEYTKDGKFTIATPTKGGYVFDGWQYKNGNKLETTVSGGNATVTLTSPSTLEPIWVETYTVAFDVNGGNGLTSDTMVVRTGKTISENDMPKPTYSGYTFDKWYTDEGKVFTCGVDKIEKDITLHAKWLFSVTVKVGEETKTYPGNSSEGITLAELETPAKDGYTFKGWYTDENLQIKAEDPIKSEGTLYPAYVCEVTLSVDKTDGDEGGKSSRDLTVNYNSQIKDVGFFDTGSNNKYISKTNRYFAGWYTEGKDGKEIEVKKDTSIEKGMTLYAKWNVSYKIDDGDEVEISEDANTLTISALNEKVNKKGWEKVTWYSGGTEIEDNTVQITTTQQKLTYTREYYKPDLGKQPSGFDNATVRTELKVDDETGKLTLPDYELGGFIFEGWYTADGKKYTVPENYKVSDKTPDLKLTPVWSKTYTIKYSTGYEGSLGSEYETAEYTRYYYEQDRLGNNDLNKNIEFPTPTVNESYTEPKEHVKTVRDYYDKNYYSYSYKFGGWKYNAGDSEVVKAEELSESISDNVTLHASWEMEPEVGKIVLFGEHNGKPLEWVILDVDETNGRILVLSLCSLENRALNKKLGDYEEYYWSKSEVCSWLNDTSDTSNTAFLVKYGLKDIYRNMANVEHDNNEYKYDNLSTGKKGTSVKKEGADTNERIFLLSFDEYCKYIANTTTGMSIFYISRYIDDPSIGTRFVSSWLRTPNRTQKDGTAYNHAALCSGADSGVYIYKSGEFEQDNVTVKDDVTGNNKLNIGDIAVDDDSRFIRPAFWYPYSK